MDQIRVCGRDTVAQLDVFLRLVGDIHVAKHVDVDGIRHDSSSSSSAAYLETVQRARNLVRSLETSVQALYDDSSVLLASVQSIRDWESQVHSPDQEITHNAIRAVSTSLSKNLKVTQQNLDGLLSIGHEQADIGQGDYTGSIEWRMSRLSMIETQPNGTLRPLSPYQEETENVDMELALSRQDARKPGHIEREYEESSRPSFSGTQVSGTETLVGQSLEPNDDDVRSLFEERTLHFIPYVISTQHSLYSHSNQWKVKAETEG